MRPLFLLTLALSLAACADPVGTPTVRPPADAALVALTTDFSDPVAPTAVSAAVVATTVRADGSTVDSILVTWIDNETRTDEFNTCAQFTGPAGEPVTTQCAYASEYDQPVGSTGERSAVVVAPAGLAAFARFWTNRFFLRETLPGQFATQSLQSDRTENIPVSSLVTVTTRGKGKRGGR
jgi:hypothetical protein